MAYLPWVIHVNAILGSKVLVFISIVPLQPQNLSDEATLLASVVIVIKLDNFSRLKPLRVVRKAFGPRHFPQVVPIHHKIAAVILRQISNFSKSLGHLLLILLLHDVFI